MKKARILLVDDHAVMREGLKRILDDCEDMQVTGEADRGETAVAMAQTGNYDLVILDISLPGRGGIEALKDLRRRKSKLPVLILSMYPEDQYGMRALKAGASGYVMKERPPKEIIAAVRKVMDGGTYVSPALVERMAADMTSKPPTRGCSKLSDREDLVLRLLTQGVPIKDIALRLSLSAKTISEYKRRILRKLRLRNLAEVIQFANENGVSPMV